MELSCLSISFSISTIFFSVSSITVSFNTNENPYGFSMNFEGVNLENTNAGDDLTQKATNYSYLLSYKNDSYWLKKSDVSKNDFKNYQGSVIVKEFDKSKKIMKVEFTDVKLPILKGIKRTKENR